LEAWLDESGICWGIIGEESCELAPNARTLESAAESVAGGGDLTPCPTQSGRLNLGEEVKETL
jgi:hypothetical protein